MDQHPVEGDARPVDGLAWPMVRGTPVQNEAPGAVGLGQTVSHNANNHRIRHQLAGVHIGFGLQTGGSLLLDGRARMFLWKW